MSFQTQLRRKPRRGRHPYKEITASSLESEPKSHRKRGRKKSRLPYFNKMVRCVPGLTDDLTVEILSRLPNESFFRFQCVSKSFLALSSDPCYQNKFPRAASGLFFNVPDGGLSPVNGERRGIQYISLSNNDEDFAMDTTLSFLPNICNMEVISSCNGLLLCRSWIARRGPMCRVYGVRARSLYVCKSNTRERAAVPVANDSYRNGLLRSRSSVARSWHMPLAPYGVKAQSFYVCNPATREWVVVPEANETYKYHYLALGFDPRISRHYHVLRFDFKEILRFMIFSTKTNEWVVSEVSEAKEFYRPQATFFHGIFYVTNGLNQALGVDPEGKFCRKIELPESNLIERLGHSGGHLHYMLQSRDEIKVWMLKDCCHIEWVLKHCINIRAMFQKHGIPETHQIHISEFHPDVDVVFLRIEKETFSYHLNSGRLEEVCNLPYTGGPVCIVYSPCLSKGLGNEVV